MASAIQGYETTPYAEYFAWCLLTGPSAEGAHTMQFGARSRLARTQGAGGWARGAVRRARPASGAAAELVRDGENPAYLAVTLSRDSADCSIQLSDLH